MPDASKILETIKCTDEQGVPVTVLKVLMPKELEMRGSTITGKRHKSIREIPEYILEDDQEVSRSDGYTFITSDDKVLTRIK